MMKHTPKFGVRFVHNQGLVLIISLLILCAITFLTLSMLESIIIGTKTSTQQIKYNDQFYDIDSVGNLISDRFSQFTRPGCMVKNLDMNESIQALKTNVCLYVHDGKTFRYNISDLGEFNDLRILSNRHSVSSHHWIITIAGHLDIIQIRYITEGSPKPCSHMKPKYIHLGRASWRYLRGYMP